MDVIFTLFIVAAFIGIPVLIIYSIISAVSSAKEGRREPTRKTYQPKAYAYTAKNSIMTLSEMDFFWKLSKIVDDRYFIFPQVHLSSLLDHHIVGQDWKRAFYHINAKSVDYVLCSKTTLQPIYAIELDDSSHDRADRVSRDIEVERIFDEANVPLVRFRDYKNLSPADIAHALADARKLSNDRSEQAFLS